MTDYYDVNLKNSRYQILKKNKNFFGYTGFIQDQKLLDDIFFAHKPKIFIHLAAQAGVRYSLDNPLSYVEANLIGSFHVFEMARKFSPEHLLIASTSSVYGDNKNIPFDENQKSDTPISFYAATKKSTEVMAHSYAHLYKIPTTIFRFFTVYGPWGRPDMALFKFTKNILSNRPIEIYNYGNMKRDFTNIDDLVNAIYLIIDLKPTKPIEREVNRKFDSISNSAPYRILNIGNSNPINLLDYVEELEKVLKKKAIKKFIKMQDGELVDTFGNIELIKELTGFRPKKKLSQGIREFVDWYKRYYMVKN